MADYSPTETQQPAPTGTLAGWTTRAAKRDGSVPRFIEELKLPAALESAFRNFWGGLVGDAATSAQTFTPALVALSQTWLWLKTSPDIEARKLRQMFAQIHYDHYEDSAKVLRSVGEGIGGAAEVRSGIAAAKAMASDTCATSESQLARREMELLEGLRENQNKMQMAASESDAIHRLRTLVAPGNLEEVLQLARRITLG